MLLRVAARVELVSLLVLLANLATVHARAVATLIGPLHGCAYLLVIGSTLAATRRGRPRLVRRSAICRVSHASWRARHGGSP